MKKLVFVLLVLCCGCASGVPPTRSTTPTPTPVPHCHVRGALPDPVCTPGAVFPVTYEQVCKAGYARSVRNVPGSEKTAIYREYGITHHVPGTYEIDHLISLELGGSNDKANLWPESYSGPNNAHDKDKVENALHQQVCSKIITLAEAQREIATNWLAVYKVGA
jgi:hypothetical protein